MAPNDAFGRGTTTNSSSVGFGRGSGGSGDGTGSGRGGASGGSSSRGGATGSGAKRDYGTIHGDLWTRPESLVDKTGTSGNKMLCNANFVRIVSDLNDNIYQYHVGFEPECDSKQMRIEIVRDQCSEIVGANTIFDGMILYVPRELTELKANCVSPLTKAPVKVTFRYATNFGRSNPQAINIYNLLIRESFKAVNYVQVQRNFFDPSKSSDVAKYGVEVWPGFETAVRLYEDGMMLCIETRFKVLRKSTVYDQMVGEFKRANGNMEVMRNNCDHAFTGQTVLTLYNNRMHRLSRFEWGMNPLSKFHHAATDKEMTFQDYFKQQYNVEIRELDQPLIVSEGRPKQPGEDPQITYLVPELCQVTGITDAMRKDFRVMKELAQYTRLTPERRVSFIMNFLGSVSKHEGMMNMFHAWGVHLDTQLVELPARCLPAEQLIGSKPVGYTGRNAEWARDVKSAGNFRSVPLKDWIILAPDIPEGTREALKFNAECQNLCNAMRVPFEDSFKWLVGGAEATTYMEATQTALHEFKNKMGRDAALIVVIVTDDNKTRYDTVKKLLCHDMPVPSQVVKLETLTGPKGENKNYTSIVLKILLQMNCKLGGAIWKVNIPLKSTMIIGYDLYHDSTMKGKTVGACVSSYDGDFTKWFSQTLPHSNPVELGENLRVFVRKALQRYFESMNSTLPDRIFVYRDGCGDGQIPHVRDQEVRQVEEACAEAGSAIGSPYKPKMAFTIITKKVNMRVFRKLGTDYKNPDPGTVVDSVVTRPERYDFYLVPQFVNQGTVTPVCYNIIHDTTAISPDNHQKLAFKLCHLYYNWQGTVRVPAPCQYAHKLAFLVAQTLHKPSNDSLRDKLFFL